MKEICKRTRITDPSGVWNYSNMIGAIVRISSMPISNLNNVFAFDSNKTYIIEDIYFRVSTDGKTITIIRLEGLPDCIFTWKDLEVLNTTLKSDAICGLCCCGQTICDEL